jgi:hypothetical protein
MDRFGSWSCKNGLEGREFWKPGSGQRQATTASISGLVPTITRVRLYARTERAISAATVGSVLVRKCVAPTTGNGAGDYLSPPKKSQRNRPGIFHFIPSCPVILSGQLKRAFAGCGRSCKLETCRFETNEQRLRPAANRNMRTAPSTLLDCHRAAPLNTAILHPPRLS